MRLFSQNPFGLPFFIALTMFWAGIFHSAHAQPDEQPQSVSNIVGPIDIKGYTKELGKDLKGVVVVLYEDADGSRKNIKELQRVVSPGNGQFTFKLNINRLYMLEFIKGGYTSKKVDIDTDVRLARPEHTKVPQFEFEVEMVKDLDGLAYKSSVAKVFYHIKRNELDYELDYTKEEMEEEERKVRELQEKMRLAEIAAKKKMEVENQALSLREREKLAAEEKIKAAVQAGGDERKIKDQFQKVFSDVDSLRQKKAEVMYLELQIEKQRTGGNTQAINFGKIFDAAQKFEDKTVAEKAAADAKKNDELRQTKQQALNKQQEALAKEQEAQKLIMQDKLAQAQAAEEAKRAAEEKAKRESVYNALLNSSGSKDKAVANLISVFPKNDPYRQEKAEAMFAEYEKARSSGKTLANLNYGDLFAAARRAEESAIDKAIDADRAKSNDKTNEILKEIDEKKLKEQDALKSKIQTSLANARTETEKKQAFIESLPKNDPYREQKGNAMYQEYVAQQQKMASGGATMPNIDFGSIFGAAQIAENAQKNKEKEELAIAKRQQQDAIEAKRDAVRQEKSKLAEDAAKVAQEVQQQKLKEAVGAKEKKLADAIAKGNGDRSKAIDAIMASFDKGTEYRGERAEAIYDAYLQELVRINNSGSTTAKIDFGKLFAAADKAELEALTKQYEAKKSEQDKQLAAYTQQRTEKAIDIAQAKTKEAEQQAAIAAANLDKTKQQVDADRQAREQEQARLREQQEKQLAMEEAKRAAELRNREQAMLSQSDREKQAELDRLKKEADLAKAKAEAEERRKQELAKAEEERRKQAELTAANKAERDRQIALEAQRKEEERLKKEQDLAAAKAKAEEDKRQEAARLEQERLKQAELAAATKAEKERLAREAAEKAEAERVRREQALAADKAEKERLAKEAAAKAEAERLERERLLAADKAEKDRIAKEAAEQKERERLALEEKKRQDAEAAAKAAEDKRKLDEQIRNLTLSGDQAYGTKKYDKAKADYEKALALKPDDRDLKKKIADTEAALGQLAAAERAEQEKEQRFQDLMKQGEQQMAENELPFAKNSFAKALEIKPTSTEARNKLRQVEDALALEVKKQEAERAKERQYVVLLQDGSKAMEVRDYKTARTKYNEALALKPDAPEPKKKLSDIKVIEDQIAADEKAKRDKEEAAKQAAQLAFQKQQEEERIRKERELAARQEALNKITNDQNKLTEQTEPSAAEKERQRKFEEIKLAIEDMSNNAEERRRMFLTELAKLYPEGVTYELVTGSNFKVDRYVINNKGTVNVYEKRTWDWGGVFYFKDGSVTITESLYNLEINRYKK